RRRRVARHVVAQAIVLVVVGDPGGIGMRGVVASNLPSVVAVRAEGVDGVLRASDRGAGPLSFARRASTACVEKVLFPRAFAVGKELDLDAGDLHDRAGVAWRAGLLPGRQEALADLIPGRTGRQWPIGGLERRDELRNIWRAHVDELGRVVLGCAG